MEHLVISGTTDDAPRSMTGSSGLHASQNWPPCSSTFAHLMQRVATIVYPFRSTTTIVLAILSCRQRFSSSNSITRKPIPSIAPETQYPA